MRTERFSISIPEPCSENWEQMKPCEGGRFCGSCQKTVIDFTAWSDDALAAFFVRKENRNACGRFYKHQLADKVFSYTAPMKKPYRTLAMAASVAALTIVSATASAQTQKKAVHPSVSTPRKNTKQPTKKPAKNLKKVVVKSKRYEKPVIVQYTKYTLTGLVAADIEKMPARDMSMGIATVPGVLKNGRSDSLNTSGRRIENTLIIIDSLSSLPPLPAALCFPQKRNLFQRVGAWFRRTF